MRKTLISILIGITIALIGCGGGGNGVTVEKNCTNCLAVNEKNEIICYPGGDYTYVLEMQCNQCHAVEFRNNP